jgi:hypothetical protein
VLEVRRDAQRPVLIIEPSLRDERPRVNERPVEPYALERRCVPPAYVLDMRRMTIDHRASLSPRT